MKQKITSNLCLCLITLMLCSITIDSRNKGNKEDISQNSYVAASVLKTLGAKEDFKKLILKFQNHCPNLRVVKSIKRSITQINNLTKKKSLRLGYSMAKTALKGIYSKKRRNLNRRRPYRRYRNSRYGDDNQLDNSSYDSPYSNNLRSFLEKKIKVKGNKRGTKLKTNNILKSMCKGVNYKNAKNKLRNFTKSLNFARKKKLVAVIKNTLRRVLARILGCKFMRKGSLSRTLRKALRKIRNKTNIKKNVFKIANVLKKITNYKRKPKIVKKTKKVMKKILSKLLKRRKLKASTLIIIKDLKKKNCKKGKKCFNNSIFSRKCYQFSKNCINLKSVLKKVNANKVGSVMSTLIKQFIS